MSEQNIGLRRVRRALLSVSDKNGIVEFARELERFGVEIISTGGTAKALREAGISVRDISDVTGFPEMMDGRVKTLHPRVHGGLLALRDNEAHVAAMLEHGIEAIDMVVVNLYPFEETIAREGVTLEEAVEQIDIGGPAMVRSASKNFRDVAVVTSTDIYDWVLEEFRENEGALTAATRMRLAMNAFMDISVYDAAIFYYLSKFVYTDENEGAEEIPADVLPDDDAIYLAKISDLRYGENPHQKAALYKIEDDDVHTMNGVAQAELLGGKEMSYNNYVDADAAWGLVCDFDSAACAIIKHTNPAGVGLGASLEEAYRHAVATDPVSAFGGIVAFNQKVDEAAARAVTEIFTEVVIAPDYEEQAIEALRAKKNLRILRAGEARCAEGFEYRQIAGGMLAQTRDVHQLTSDALKVVTKREPTEEEVRALLFAWKVCKHTKSNAIVYAREGQTVGVGAGQMSRVDSVKLGAMRAQLPVAGSVLASDAFFPFRDGVDEAARHGITAIIQPGGSVRDEEVIAAADEHGLAMVFTGVRHFKH
ncbi:MAG: bifunctional phosphoribosylaminoimidazolecarboxamide formyltransferase/IMP cyclohydrolase [Acidobacteria bacterium]|nr:bifunctional phosphoribosylaminoimidazolecarboxamide formyltransferase/IMP cyclohydrolase [Acidobacteriota bacterium]